MSNRSIDIKEFAIRVERMCDFFINRLTQEIGRDGSDDLKVLEDLREQAGDIQVSTSYARETITGLDNYMKGLPDTKES